MIPSARMLDTRALSINKSKLIILASAPLLITTSLRKLVFKITFSFLIILACKSSLVSKIRFLSKNSSNKCSNLLIGAYVKKPRFPKLIPKTGFLFFAAASAICKSVPSPPRTIKTSEFFIT